MSGLFQRTGAGVTTGSKLLAAAAFGGVVFLLCLVLAFDMKRMGGPTRCPPIHPPVAVPPAPPPAPATLLSAQLSDAAKLFEEAVAHVKLTEGEDKLEYLKAVATVHEAVALFRKYAGLVGDDITRAEVKATDPNGESAENTGVAGADEGGSGDPEEEQSAQENTPSPDVLSEQPESASEATGTGAGTASQASAKMDKQSKQSKPRSSSDGIVREIGSTKFFRDKKSMAEYQAKLKAKGIKYNRKDHKISKDKSDRSAIKREQSKLLSKETRQVCSGLAQVLEGHWEGVGCNSARFEVPHCRFDRPTQSTPVSKWQIVASSLPLLSGKRVLFLGDSQTYRLASTFMEALPGCKVAKTAKYKMPHSTYPFLGIAWNEQVEQALSTRPMFNEGPVHSLTNGKSTGQGDCRTCTPFVAECGEGIQVDYFPLEFARDVIVHTDDHRTTQEQLFLGSVYSAAPSAGAALGAPASKPVDFMFFNTGLHDMSLQKDGLTEQQFYDMMEKNYDYLFGLSAHMPGKHYWVTSSYVNDSYVPLEHRTYSQNKFARSLNRVATGVAEKHRIPIIDVYGLSLGASALYTDAMHLDAQDKAYYKALVDILLYSMGGLV